MKKIFFGILVSSLLSVVPSNQVDALSCVYTQPIVGIVDTITDGDEQIEIELREIKTFNQSKFSGVIDIDLYRTIVSGYVTGDFTGLEDPNEEAFVGVISVPQNTHEVAGLQVGDVVVNGPPFHVCTYRFTGVFDADGDIKSVIINDNYQSYLYRGEKIDVAKAGEIECTEHNRCSYKGSFSVGGTEKVLMPGESWLVGKSISRINFIEASDTKVAEDGTGVFDWGFGTYVTYVLTFNTDVVVIDPPGQPESPLLPTEEPPTPIDEEKPQISETPEIEEPAEELPPTEKRDSLFKRFMDWLFGLFG